MTNLITVFGQLIDLIIGVPTKIVTELMKTGNEMLLIPVVAGLIFMGIKLFRQLKH